MKFFVYVLFQMLPWLPWVGDWALKWTEGNNTLQIVFTMFFFPLIMNAIQYYIVDSFIKEKNPGDQGQNDQRREGDEATEENDERGRLMADNDDVDNNGEDEEHQYEARKDRVLTNSEEEPLKEINPTPIPAENER